MRGGDRNFAPLPSPARTKLLTLESWLTHAAWYEYALAR